MRFIVSVERNGTATGGNLARVAEEVKRLLPVSVVLWPKASLLLVSCPDSLAHEVREKVSACNHVLDVVEDFGIELAPFQVEH
jgi:hypothetical protein